MGYAKIACCDHCGKKRYVERVNGKWLCLDCQDIVTERTAAAIRAGSRAPSVALIGALAATVTELFQRVLR
jgi:hypothetical protein